jgi:hypothetical protein
MSAKPQLTMYEGGGFHNTDLAKAHSRILADGSWKKQRVVVVIPAADSVPTLTYLAHRNIGFPPNQQNVWIAAEGMEVGEAYSQAITGILANPELGQWEYLLTIEHDNLPPPDGVLRLIKQMEAHPEFACIGGLYWTKGYGGVPQIWGDPRDPVLNFRPQPPDPNGGLVECCGTGMGFNLWRLAMFKDDRLRKPWFKTGEGHTQDLWFWSDARKYGYRCTIDCSVKVGHLDYSGAFGQKGMVW